ncbi:rRNA-processing protein UTP23 homolog [Rhagoletis pomonella]|uniref:rRNA-processing protein UTP23 homolog n=1 Tax=Rhagoletis pomonella TaxID=28610 RepID=UPI0017849B7F|nr:rRNA-processing protein UTP23 homolog [Rhagoletis pomonella]
MKISRFKKLHKTVTFFATNFQYREPYQVLVDATFCQAALQNKVIIEEQLKKYFHATIKLVTTQCIILEAESLGANLAGATMIVKKFCVHKCGHEGVPVSASQCIKSMAHAGRYIVASQDRTLQTSLRKVPGRCLLYLHKSTPVLEEPSEASKKYVLKKSQNLLTNDIEKRIEHLKQEEGIQEEHLDKIQRKRKGTKNPNPLSCKRSKKPKDHTQNLHVSKRHLALNESSKTPTKSKRKRIQIPAHVKAALKSPQ